jgi:hypothetical protein
VCHSFARPRILTKDEAILPSQRMSHSRWTLSLSDETEKHSNTFQEGLDTETLGLTDLPSVEIWLGQRHKPCRWQLQCFPKCCKKFENSTRVFTKAEVIRYTQQLNSKDRNNSSLFYFRDCRIWSKVCVERLSLHWFVTVNGIGLRSLWVWQKWLNSPELEIISSKLVCFPRLSVIRQDLSLLLLFDGNHFAYASYKSGKWAGPCFKDLNCHPQVSVLHTCFASGGETSGRTQF